MKTLNKINILMAAFWSISLSTALETAFADSKSNVVYTEGTETNLTDAQFDEIKEWAVRSEFTLQQLKRSLRFKTTLEKKKELIFQFKSIVDSSRFKKPETMMRYVLNRGLKIIQEIDKETDANIPGVVDTEVKILNQSIDLTLKYFRTDQDFLQARQDGSPDAELELFVSFSEFGMDYTNFLIKLNDEKIRDASAHYNIGVMALGMLHVDLARDKYARAHYAPVIGKIRSILAQYPETAGTDDVASTQLYYNIRIAYRDAQSLMIPLLKTDQQERSRAIEETREARRLTAENRQKEIQKIQADEERALKEAEANRLAIEKQAQQEQEKIENEKKRAEQIAEIRRMEQELAHTLLHYGIENSHYTSLVYLIDTKEGNDHVFSSLDINDEVSEKSTILGCALKSNSHGVVALTTYTNDKDSMTILSEQLGKSLRQTGYKRRSYPAFVFPSRRGDSVPLFHYFSKSRDDHYTTTEKIQEADEGEYELSGFGSPNGIAGYVIPVGVCNQISDLIKRKKL